MRKSARLAALVAGPVMVLGIGAAAAAPAMASTGPTGSITCTPANQETLNGMGTINKNLDVPAGQTCQLRWVHVTGNVTVEGAMAAASDVFDRNVTANGGSFDTFNQASHILGNLTVTNSPGDPYNNGAALSDHTQYPGQNGAAATTQVDGNITFTNNTGWIGLFNSIHANGNFTSSGNVFPNSNWFNISGLSVGGSLNVS